MKKLFFALAIIFVAAFSNAQTCSSPILLDGLNGGFTTLDSFNVQSRFFKFTANNTQHRIKAIIKRLNTIHSGNIYLNLYTNNCGSLPASQLTVTPTTSGDTLIINYSSFTPNVEYLMEVGKIVNNSNFVAVSASVNNILASFTWGCSTCTSTNSTCELVCNGSFECLATPVTTWNPPGGNTAANNWVSATLSSPDIFTSTTFTPYNVPCNVFGSENGHTGTNYAGISMDNGGYSEYIETQLVSAMQANKKYIISFWVSKADNPTAQIQALAVFVTTAAISWNSQFDLPNSLYPATNMLVNTASLNVIGGWTKITFCYTAIGNEQYLTIGRPPGYLSSNGPTPSFACPITTQQAAGMDQYSFLYLDDVSVKLFDVSAGATQTVNVCGTATLNSNFTCGSPSLNSVSYSWFGSNGFSSSLANTTTTLNSTTNFNITVTGFDSNNQSCAATSTLAVISNTPFPITLSPSATTICPGAAVTITATGSAATCTFSPGGVGNIQTFNPTVTTTYAVTGTTSGGCVMTKTITIYTHTSNVTPVATPASICTGFSSTLTASNGSSFSWQPGSLSGTPVIVSPTITTTYTLTGTTVNGCVRTNTVTVIVNNPSTINVLPSSTNSICLNSSINLIASGASTYTWQPGNVVNASNLVSPTVNTIYTVSATNSFGCIGTKTVSVFINPLPTVNCSTSNTTTCPGLTATLSASGAVTYTWLPATVSSTVAVSPTVTTSYTVIGTSALGCTNSCVLTQSVFPTTINFFTVTATPSVICTMPPFNTTSTLNVIGVPNFTWLPSGPTNTTITTTAPGIFSASATYSNGCTYTQTLNLPEPGPDPSLNLTTVCNGQTINLASYTSPSGGTYSVNGVASSSVIGPLTPGTYTINYTYTAGIVCNPNLTSTFVVLPTVVTPTIVSTGTLICSTTPNITLTAQPNTQTYLWNPGVFIGNPYVVSPLSSTVYTVQVGSLVGNCIQTATFGVTVNTTTVPCNCFSNCTNPLPINLTTSPASNTVYCVTNNISINGTVTFSNSDFKIYPNVSITVYPNAILNIVGCHLYSCDNMWQGITVLQGGRLNISTSSTSRTSLIEDAFVAVDFSVTASGFTTTNVFTADNATFNRNQISIRLNKFDGNQTTYPYTINNCLFTSRTITFSALSHPATNTIKNGASGNLSPLQTPYINDATYPALGMKGPLTGVFPSTGIVLDQNGYTTIPLGATFKGISIGTTGANNFNCFDNLREDINAHNSNFTVVNSVFQNAQRYGKGLTSGGKAIVAVSDNGNSSAYNNNEIKLLSATNNTLNTNLFYDKVSCADVTGYLGAVIQYAKVYSYTNNYNLYNTLGVTGNRAFNLNTNRYYYTTVQYNEIYNIKNAILVGLDNGYFNVGPNSGTGRIVGTMDITYNKISKHPVAPVSNEYVNIGVSISDPFSASSTTTSPMGCYSSVNNNTFTNVHNGVSASNIGFTVVHVNNNSITMVNEPSTFFTPTQNGVLTTQLGNSNITLNNISGPASYTNEISAVKTSMNSQLAVKCNTTANTYHGLNFNASQAITSVQDNIMQSQKYGISMTNTATIGTQGNSTTPTNNQWLGTWTGNFKTMNYNQYSTAINSKIYATWGGALDPNGSSTVVATPGLMNQDNYFHLATTNPVNTILNASSISPTCRLGGGGQGGSGFAAMNSQSAPNNTISITQKSLLESLVSTSSANLSNEVKYIDKNRVYRTLEANTNYTTGSAVLSTFYSNALTSCMQKFVAVEKDLGSGNIAAAQSQLAALTTTNSVENNYKAYYNLYIKLKIATFNSADSSVLLNLCNQCPYTDGGVVYQARALYNIMNNSYSNFNDNCNLSVGSRLFDNIVKDDTDVNVLIKTKLYPNPNNGEFTIEVNKQTEGNIEEITIYDLGGKILYTNLESGSSIKVNTKLLKGSYLVKVRLSNNSVDVHRIIID